MTKNTRIYIRSYDSDMRHSNTRSVGFCSLLTLVFITLKLTGYIDWSWWWVLGPLWIPLTVLLCATVAVWAVSDGLDWWQSRRKKRCSKS